MRDVMAQGYGKSHVQYTVAQVRQSAQSAIAVVVSLYIIFHNAAEGRQVHNM